MESKENGSTTVEDHWDTAKPAIRGKYKKTFFLVNIRHVIYHDIP